ncbi:DUF58 domain-containing protein [Thalassotalea piscium]
MSIFTNMQQWVEGKFQRWLSKQVPKNKRQVLSRRNIFIFPSKFGFSYLFFVLLLFILGTNYQNNLIILVSYLLSSLFITTMIQSFNNLSKLTLIINSEKFRGFSGTRFNVPILLCTDKERLAFQLYFQQDQIIEKISITSDETLSVPIELENRGVFSLPRLILQSYYPLGLFRCWTSVDLHSDVLVYPKPERPEQIDIERLLTGNDNEDGLPLSNEVKTLNNGVDEFNDLSPYQQGESLAKVAWKHVASGKGWYSKNYQHLITSTPNWLSLDSLPKAPLEQQLRWLSYLILEFQKRDIVFGLKLNTLEIAPQQGIEHCHLCLREIALYG